MLSFIASKCFMLMCFFRPTEFRQHGIGAYILALHPVFGTTCCLSFLPYRTIKSKKGQKKKRACRSKPTRYLMNHNQTASEGRAAKMRFAKANSIFSCAFDECAATQWSFVYRFQPHILRYPGKRILAGHAGDHRGNQPILLCQW